MSFLICFEQNQLKSIEIWNKINHDSQKISDLARNGHRFINKVRLYNPLLWTTSSNNRIKLCTQSIETKSNIEKISLRHVIHTQHRTHSSKTHFKFTFTVVVSYCLAVKFNNKIYIYLLNWFVLIFMLHAIAVFSYC